MRELLTQARPWWEAAQPFGLATVVATWQSAPRPAGAAMAVSQTGEVIGSVSGGCVESTVYELAREVTETGAPVRQRFGVSDHDALAVGLTCGGTIDVYVEPVQPASFPEFGAIADAVAAQRPIALATVVGGPEPLGARLLIGPRHASGTLGSDRLDAAVIDDARGMLEQGVTGTVSLGADGQRRGDTLQVLVQSFAPQPRMLVFGAIDFAAAVAEIGTFLGYRVTVCDAREVFATRRRFPSAAEVVVDWPHRYLAGTEVDHRSVICVLTHDPKFDVPLLLEALGTDAGYIGVMGSRRTHADRLARLREHGVSPVALDRLAAPIGLDLGARTPQETAVSIAAEIVAHRWGGTGRPLASTAGRIHHDPDHR